MVDMGVRENNTVDVTRIKAEVAVHGICLLTLTLKHAAIEQDLFAFFGGDEVLGAGDFTSCTEELNS